MKYVSQISSLEEQVEQHEHQLAALHMMLLAAIRRFETDMERLGSELTAVRDTKNTEAAAPDRLSRKKFPPAAVSLSVPPARPLLARAKFGQHAVPSVPAQIARLDSLIVSEYPPLFEEFRMKRWTVLWRGSRDGFTAKGFHRRCDRHANTLTLILDTDGNVFGGFTPVERESPLNWKTKGDDSLRSFLFTLRNPHGVPPRKFALNEEKKAGAICCRDELCALFGEWCEILVSDNCNTNRNSYTRIGTRYGNKTYENDTQFEDLFTGAWNFTVKEIEVFEIEN
jgi:hypothetical protein